MVHGQEDAPSAGELMVFKTILNKDIRRFKSTNNKISALLDHLHKAYGSGLTKGGVVMKYQDGEGDQITMLTDEDLWDAVLDAREQGQSTLKILVSQQPPPSSIPSTLSSISARTSDSFSLSSLNATAQPFNYKSTVASSNNFAEQNSPHITKGIQPTAATPLQQLPTFGIPHAPFVPHSLEPPYVHASQPGSSGPTMQLVQSNFPNLHPTLAQQVSSMLQLPYSHANNIYPPQIVNAPIQPLLPSFPSQLGDVHPILAPDGIRFLHRSTFPVNDVRYRPPQPQLDGWFVAFPLLLSLSYFRSIALRLCFSAFSYAL